MQIAIYQLFRITNSVWSGNPVLLKNRPRPISFSHHVAPLQHLADWIRGARLTRALAIVTLQHAKVVKDGRHSVNYRIPVRTDKAGWLELDEAA